MRFFLDWLCSFPWQHKKNIALTFHFVINKSQLNKNLSYVKTLEFCLFVFKYYFWNQHLLLKSLGSLITCYFFVVFLWRMFLLFFFNGYSSLLKGLGFWFGGPFMGLQLDKLRFQSSLEQVKIQTSRAQQAARALHPLPMETLSPSSLTRACPALSGPLSKLGSFTPWCLALSKLYNHFRTQLSC